MSTDIITPEERQYDHLLSLIMDINQKVNDRISQNTLSNDSKVIELEDKMTSLSAKFTSISNQFSVQKLKTDKIDEFTSFSSKTTDQLTTHEIRINNLMKDLSNAKYKYDKVFIDNLIVPGFIGDFCKYKNLKEYLDNNIKEMSILVNYKEKTSMDLKSYKERLEGLIRDFQRQTSLFTSQQQARCDDVMEECLKYTDKCREDVFAKYDEIQLTNSKYSVELKDKANQLQVEWDKIITIKEEIYKRFDVSIEEIKTDNGKTINEFNSYKGEFNKIKSRFGELIEFIKDVRFRKNLVTFEEIKKREVMQLTDKLNFNKNRRKSIEELPSKALDLKYDFFTGKETISDDDSVEIQSNPTLTNFPNKKSSVPLSLRYEKDRDKEKERERDKDREYPGSDNKNCSIIPESSILSSDSQVRNKEKDKEKEKDKDKRKEKFQSIKQELFSDDITIEQSDQITKAKYSPVHEGPRRSSFYNDKRTFGKNFHNTSSKFPSVTRGKARHSSVHNNGNAIISNQVEGKVVTLHFREPSNPKGFHPYDNTESIEIALKPSTALNARRETKKFGTVKESKKVLNKMFLSNSPQQQRTNSKKQSRLDKPKDPKKKDNKESIDCNNINLKKMKLSYETTEKLINNFAPMNDSGNNINSNNNSNVGDGNNSGSVAPMK